MNILRFALFLIVATAFLWAFVPQALHAQSPVPGPAPASPAAQHDSR